MSNKGETMLVPELKYWVLMLPWDDWGLNCLSSLNGIFNKHISAIVSRKTFGFVDCDNEINSLTDQIFRFVRDHLVFWIIPARLISWDDIDIKESNSSRIIIWTDKCDLVRIVNQVGESSQLVVSLTNELRLRRVNKWISKRPSKVRSSVCLEVDVDKFSDRVNSINELLLVPEVLFSPLIIGDFHL